MLVIKAGGSSITRAGQKPVFDRRAAARLAAAIALLDEPLILTHGTGSYGKPPAVRYGYLDGRIRRGAAPVTEIKASLRELHGLFVAELLAAGVKAVSCPGCEVFALKRGRLVLSATRRLSSLLARGCVPVVNSDLFPCGGGFRVVSSDAIAAELAAAFKPRLAVFFTAAQGLTGPGGKVIGELNAAGLKLFRKICRPSPGDVSGGMAGKAAELARLNALGVDSFIADGRRPGELLKFLSGGRACGTLVRAE